MFNFWSDWAPNWLIFLAISRGHISREKCLANPFPVLARNARNVPVYIPPSRLIKAGWYWKRYWKELKMCHFDEFLTFEKNCLYSQSKKVLSIFSGCLLWRTRTWRCGWVQERVLQMVFWDWKGFSPCGWKFSTYEFGCQIPPNCSGWNIKKFIG